MTVEITILIYVLSFSNARATVVSKQQIQKIDDHDRIGGVFGYIESLNERLVNFRLDSR